MRERARVSGRGVCDMKRKNEPFLALKQGNVATFGATSRRSRGLLKSTSRLWKPRRDIPEGYENPRRDIENPRRDVTEALKIDVTTFEIHVAT